ncbi:MAG: hypothetical protein JWM57_992 [Phycisphaerales bacterium]|nr:hypothetical protein [Phycisphaerales bacterium]
MSDAVTYLLQAIERYAKAVLTVVSNSAPRLTRSRLLAVDGKSLWIGLPTDQADTIDGMIHRQAEARVNFRLQQTNVEFHARVLERRQAYQLNTTTTCEAVRLAWPTNIAIVQRRNSYRVGVASPVEVRLKFWRIDKEANLTAIPPAGSDINIDVRDFSESGVGGVWKRRAGEDPILQSDQRLRVDVITPTGTITVDAFVRFLAGLPEPEFRRIGVQFMFNRTNLADRTKMSTLGRLVGDLQRAELKRLRIAR